MNIAEFSSLQIQVFLLIFIRITAILSLLPVLGSNNVPRQLKVGLSFMIAILVFPFVGIPDSLTSNFNVALFIVSVVKELIIGMTIGYTSLFLMAAVQFAGRLIDTQMGFALTQVVDPFNNSPTTVAGQFQILIYSLIFLLINGHYFLLIALVRSFEVIPLFGMQIPTDSLMEFFVMITARLFVLSFKLAGPVFAVLLLGSLSLGIVARTVPQMNVFFVGIPMKIGVGLMVLGFALPAMTVVFRDMTTILVDDIWKLLYIM